MIISRAPLRVSFLGGITDYPEYFMREGKNGAVLGSTINKWVNVMILPQPDFELVKYRFTYRITEAVDNFDEIMHPVVRTALREKDWHQPINIATMAQLPGRSGLGSSSAFTVALLAGLHAVENLNEPLDKEVIAMEAVRIERDLIGEVGGIQDQYHATMGGFRLYKFGRGGVTHLRVGTDRLIEYFSSSLVLIATGGGRDSKLYAGITQNRILEKKRIKLLDEMSTLTEDVAQQIQNVSPSVKALDLLGSAINEAWKIKVELSGHQSSEVDDLLDFGLKNGALGAKLCGAGGSGFAAFLVEPEKRMDFISKFPARDVIDAQFSEGGVNVQKVFA